MKITIIEEPNRKLLEVKDGKKGISYEVYTQSEIISLIKRFIKN